MAAIFALVFVPALAAILFMLGGTVGHVSFGTAFAALTFVALAGFLLTQLFRLAHHWDHDGV